MPVASELPPTRTAVFRQRVVANHRLRVRSFPLLLLRGVTACCCRGIHGAFSPSLMLPITLSEFPITQRLAATRRAPFLTRRTKRRLVGWVMPSPFGAGCKTGPRRRWPAGRPVATCVAEAARRHVQSALSSGRAAGIRGAARSCTGGGISAICPPCDCGGVYACAEGVPNV